MNIVIYGVTQAQYSKIEDIVLFTGEEHTVENTADLEKDFELGGEFVVLDQVDLVVPAN